MFLPRALALSVLAATLLACPDQKTEAPPAPKPPTPAAKLGKVTLLITGHETGSLPAKGARLLAQWKKEDGWPDALAFSTGDAFAGAVLSSHFDGTPTAEVMKALQYKASAFGNHDLDLGQATLEKFRQESGVQFLAANLKDKTGSERPLKLVPSALFDREGVKVGVVGLTSPKTLTTTEAGRATELELLKLDAALGPALDALKKDAPDLTLVLLDDCYQALQPVLAGHAEWKVDLVVGTRCEGEQQEATVGTTRFFSTGDGLSHYVAAKFELKADGTKSLSATRKDVAAEGEEDADLVALRQRWTEKLNAAMGEKLGFAKTGFKEDSVELRTLVATALRDQTKADGALINKKGLRAPLPAGAITRATVYDVMPFENALITVKLPGEVLQKLKSHPDGFVVAPAKLEPEKLYTVATTEYLYFGGDGLGLELVAPNPDFTGEVWQTPVVEWLRGQKTDEKKPLEAVVKALK